MSPDRVSNPGRLAFESDPPLTPLRGPARVAVVVLFFYVHGHVGTVLFPGRLRPSKR